MKCRRLSIWSTSKRQLSRPTIGRAIALDRKRDALRLRLVPDAVGRSDKHVSEFRSTHSHSALLNTWDSARQRPLRYSEPWGRFLFPVCVPGFEVATAFAKFPLKDHPCRRK